MEAEKQRNCRGEEKLAGTKLSPASENRKKVEKTTGNIWTTVRRQIRIPAALKRPLRGTSEQFLVFGVELMQSDKLFALFVLSSAILLPFGSLHAATLTINTTEPTGPGVVIANPHTTFTSGSPGPLGERDTFTTIFPVSAGAGSRGQSFFMPNNPVGPSWDCAITLRADANAAGTGAAQDLSSGGPNTLKLWIFEWNPNTDATDGTQWTLGNGAADNDPFNGTNVTNFLVNGESFDVTRTFSGEFLHFNTPGVQLAENTAYGIILSFESLAAGFKLDDVRDGMRPTVNPIQTADTRSDTSSNSVGSNGDDLVFYVEATSVVPEPATATLLVLGSMALLASPRKKRDRTIY